MGSVLSPSRKKGKEPEPKQHDDWITETRMLPIDALFCDDYQRDLSPVWLHPKAGAVRELNLAMIGTPAVSDRRNGTYAVVDGQHRLELLRLHGVPTVRCEVHLGLTYEDEAILFYLLNEHRRAQTSRGTHHARVQGRDPISLAIEEIAARHGFSIGSGGSGVIRSPKPLYDAYEKYSPHALEVALLLIRAWDPKDKEALSSPMIRGLALLIHTYEGELVPKQLVLRLQKITPTRIKREAHDSTQGGAQWTRVARRLLEQYNHRRVNRLNPQRLERGSWT